MVLPVVVTVGTIGVGLEDFANLALGIRPVEVVAAVGIENRVEQTGCQGLADL